MGCPSLGEHTQVEVVIEESYEFKVSVFARAHPVSTSLLTGMCAHVHVSVPFSFALQKPFRMYQQLISLILSHAEKIITPSLAAIKSAALNIN